MYIPEPTHKKWTAGEWLDKLRNGKVKLDLGFQSRARWDKTDKRMYLYNFAQNIAPSPIVVTYVEYVHTGGMNRNINILLINIKNIYKI